MLLEIWYGLNMFNLELHPNNYEMHAVESW